MNTKIILVIIAMLGGFGASAQEFEKPAEGKSLVYFVRSSGTGALINFKYFDGEEYLGKLNGMNYIAYECDPGEHIFWVAAENREYMKGDLKPNATYVIQVKPVIGAVKSAVRLFQLSADDEKPLAKAKKLMTKKQPSKLKGQEEDMAFFIKNGMERYQKDLVLNKVKVINSEWTF